MKTVAAKSCSRLTGFTGVLIVLACAGGSVTNAQDRNSNLTTVESASYSVPDSRPFEPDQRSVLEPAAVTGRRITPQGKSSGQATNRSGSPVTTFVVLLFVIGVIALVWRLMKKGGAIRSGLPSEAVEVLGHKVLAHRQAIQIVRVGTRILVLNSSADGLSTLSEITDPVEVAALEHSCRAAAPAKSVVDIFAPRQTTTARKSQRETRSLRTELRDTPLGDVHA